MWLLIEMKRIYSKLDFPLVWGSKFLKNSLVDPHSIWIKVGIETEVKIVEWSKTHPHMPKRALEGGHMSAVTSENSYIRKCSSDVNNKFCTYART